MTKKSRTQTQGPKSGKVGARPRAQHIRSRNAGSPNGAPSRPRQEQLKSPNRGPGTPDQRAARPNPDRQAGHKLSGQPLIWGYHPVSEALRSPRRKILKLFTTSAAAQRLSDSIAAKHIEPIILDPAELDRLLPKDAVHQGLAAEIVLLPQPDLSELPGEGLVLVLDQITDPHNIGAVIRSAAAFAVSAIVMTERNAPPLAGIVAKSASGGLEHVPVVSVVNLARALDELGRLGYWRIGLDTDGTAPLQASSRRPLALVLGAEGKGLRRLTRENCDEIQRLDMPGPIKSLNVSNACAVALSMVQTG